MSTLEQLERAFREAADDLAGRDPRESTAAELRARLMLQQVRRGTRWMEEARVTTGTSGVPGASEDPAADWLFACCEGWVQSAAGPFRRAAEAWLEEIQDGPDAVPALLFYWRITGDRPVLERALAATPATLMPGDLVGARAVWAAYQATADETFAERARGALPADPAALPVSSWRLASHVHALPREAFAHAIDGWSDAPPRPEDALLLCAHLALPPLVVDVHWWYEGDLFSGMVAESATFPYPNVVLQFRRLPEPGQAVLTPILDGVASEPLEDIGVIAALIDEVVSHVDRTALRDAPRRRRSSSRLR